MMIPDLVAVLELTPAWVLIAFASVGIVATCFAVLLILPQEE